MALPPLPGSISSEVGPQNQGRLRFRHRRAERATCREHARAVSGTAAVCGRGVPAGGNGCPLGALPHQPGLFRELVTVPSGVSRESHPPGGCNAGAECALSKDAAAGAFAGPGAVSGVQREPEQLDVAAAVRRNDRAASGLAIAEFLALAFRAEWDSGKAGLVRI